MRLSKYIISLLIVAGLVSLFLIFFYPDNNLKFNGLVMLVLILIIVLLQVLDKKKTLPVITIPVKEVVKK